jgi:hypothetical protein
VKLTLSVTNSLQNKWQSDYDITQFFSPCLSVDNVTTTINNNNNTSHYSNMKSILPGYKSCRVTAEENLLKMWIKIVLITLIFALVQTATTPATSIQKRGDSL